jgi:hypothetical protein
LDGVENSGFHRDVEDGFRMVHQEGVQGIVTGNKGRDGVLSCPAGPPDLLEQ